VRLSFVVADCAVGWVESVTVRATVAVPTELDAGVPEIMPVEPLTVRPVGRPVALNVYGVVPPNAVIEVL